MTTRLPLHNKRMSHIPRIHLPAAQEGSTAPLDSALEHHLTRVLRLRDGAAMLAFDGHGREFSAELKTLGDTNEILIGRLQREEPPPNLRIQLVVAISRHTRMEWTLEKAVELGVSAIRPVFSERSRVRLDQRRAERKLSHWQSLVVAAAAQSDRCWLPTLATPEPLETLWSEMLDDTRLVLDPQSPKALAELSPAAGDLSLLVGPESGFSDSERSKASTAGWLPVRLGPHVLRAETAGPAAIAAIQALWGNWR